MPDACKIIDFPMSTPMGDLAPDLGVQPFARRFEVPEWAEDSRQVQGQTCPDHPDFGTAVARIGLYDMAMPVHPQLQTFHKGIQLGGRFRDDKPLEVLNDDNTVSYVQATRIGFKHAEQNGQPINGYAAQKEFRQRFVVAEDPGDIDHNNPHRQVFNMTFIRDDRGIWMVGAAHPSTSFADYRRAVGSDTSGDYFGVGNSKGGVDWELAWASIVSEGATEQPAHMWEDLAAVATIHVSGGPVMQAQSDGGDDKPCSCHNNIVVPDVDNVDLDAIDPEEYETLKARVAEYEQADLERQNAEHEAVLAAAVEALGEEEPAA